MTNKIYIGNLPYRATEDDLRQIFSQAGTVVSVRIVSDANTGRSKGFGFIEMETDDMAKKAIDQFNGTDFQGRSLRVAEARPPSREQSPRRNRY